MSTLPPSDWTDLSAYRPVEFAEGYVARIVVTGRARRTGGLHDSVNDTLDRHDPKRRHPDITRLRELLDREPRVPRREGLSLVHGWYLEERRHGRS